MWMLSRRFALLVLAVCALTELGIISPIAVEAGLKCHVCTEDYPHYCSSFSDLGNLRECPKGFKMCRLAHFQSSPTETAKIHRDCAVAGANDSVSYCGDFNTNISYSCACNTNGCNTNCDYCFDPSKPWPTGPPVEGEGPAFGSGASGGIRLLSSGITLIITLLWLKTL